MHKRRYADVSFGQIHYRVAGKGPALLLLHQSPRSSSEYADLIDAWSSHFTIYAMDTPGNGMSDPLPLDVPTIADYTCALIEFLDVLKLESCLLYGFHTGASIATSTAVRHPDRIRFAVANGVAIIRGAFQQDLLENYSPPLIPKDDGSHLTWLWDRLQKQSKFFPWYKSGDEFRLNIPPYTADRCQAMVEDFLLAGNNYIAPYNAAFRFDPVAEGLLPGDNLLIMSAATDPLSQYLDLLPDEQAIYRGRTPDDCLEKAFSLLTTSG